MTPYRDKRPLVLDGRLKGSIGEGKVHALLWLVQRSDKLSECSLTLEYPEVDVTVNVKIENGKLKRKWAHVWGAGELPRCPILTNNAKISANTRLVAREGVDLKVLSEKKQRPTP